jgi:DNA-binding NarL/FixJ family response regulator
MRTKERRSNGESRERAASTTCLDLAFRPRYEDSHIHTFRIGSEEYLVFSFAPEARDEAEFCPSVKLTHVEREVVRRIVEGCSNAGIAAARGVSPRTIANQVSVIFRKLGVGSRRELIALNREQGSGRP